MNIEKIVYGGHSAAYLHSKDLVVAIDPWVTGNPSCPPALQNPERIDLIVLTHGHADHASDAARFAKSLGSTIAATWELAMIMINVEGVPSSQVIPMNKGGTAPYKNIKISLTQALHSSSYDTPQGPMYAGEPCGVVIHGGSQTLYHAGDTALFSDMALIREMYKPTIALLPSGDRFTMGPKEAAKAAKIIGARINIPIHHSTFDLLTGTPEEFKKECAAVDVEAVVLKPGQVYTVG